VNGALSNFHTDIKIRANFNINVLSMLYKATVGKNTEHAEPLVVSWQGVVFFLFYK